MRIPRPGLWLRFFLAFALTGILSSGAFILFSQALARPTVGSFLLERDRQKALSLSQEIGAYLDGGGSLEGIGEFLSESGFMRGMGMWGQGQGMGQRPGQGMGQRARGQAMDPSPDDADPRRAPGNVPVPSLPEDAPGRFLVTDLHGLVIFGNALMGLGASYPAAPKRGVAFKQGGRTMGYVLTGAMILAGASRSDRHLQEVVLRSAVLGALTSLALALAISFGLALNLASPLRNLSAAAAQVAGGDLSVRLAESRRDEFGDLARSFNRMTASLNASLGARVRLVQDAAHELRTPVTVIRGNVEMILEGIYPADRERLLAIQAEAERLGRLIASLKELSDLDSGGLPLVLESVDPLALAQEFAKAYEGLCQARGLTLSVELISEPPSPVPMDRDRVKQILSALMDNALRYSPGGSCIRLILGESARDSDAFFFFRLEDEGPGVAEAERHRIFERFHRADQAGQGSGLGLAIALELARAQGGKLEYQVGKRGGAAFVLSLPLFGPRPNPA